MKIHREGRSVLVIAWILVLALVTLFWLYIPGDLIWLTWILSAGGAFLLFIITRFFRYPAREVTWDENDVISPADGKIVAIERVMEDEYSGEERVVVSIFMSIWNVHANWMPVTGTLEYYQYHPGKFLIAKHPKSSVLNERTSVGIYHPEWGKVMVRQIAGAVARRIICYAKEGEKVKAGDELGFIRFGSRLDVFLPRDTKLNVQLGDRVTGHETVLARLVDN